MKSEESEKRKQLKICLSGLFYYFNVIYLGVIMIFHLFSKKIDYTNALLMALLFGIMYIVQLLESRQDETVYIVKLDKDAKEQIENNKEEREKKETHE